MSRRVTFSLHSQLILILLLLVLFATAVLGWIASRTSRDIAERDGVRSVGITAAAREQLLLKLLKRHHERASSFLKLARLNCQNFPDRAACLKKDLENFMHTEKGLSAWFFDEGVSISAGDVSSTIPSLPLPDGNQFARFMPGEKGPTYLIWARAQEGASGVTLRFDVGDIYDIFVERYGIGRSGETFLADPTGVPITPLNDSSRGGGNRSIEGAPMKSCLAGQDGEAVDRDDRGNEIIVAFRHIEEIGGGCVMAHVDRAEAFAPALRMRREMAGLGALFAVFAIGLSFLFARRISGPITRLTSRARALQRGDFESPVPVEGPSEFQTFAQTFAEMAYSLKESRTALIQSQERIRAVLENALDAVIGIDEEGRIIDWNTQAASLFGWSGEEALGRLLSETVIPSHYREAHNRGMEDFFKTGKGTILNRKIEISALRKDGSEFPIELSVTPIRTGHSTVFYGFVSDISERKEAERQIRFQAHLLNVVGQAVIASDLNGKITYWNHFAETLYGWPAPEAIGRNILDVTPTETSRQEALTIMERLKNGESWSGEFLVRRLDGSLFPAMVTNAPVRNGKGKVVGIVGVSIDITERKRGEAALQEAHAELKDKMVALKKQLHLAQVLHRISGQFAVEQEVGLFYEEIVREVVKLTETNRCAIFFIEADRNRIIPRAFYGFDKETIGRIALPLPGTSGDLFYDLLVRGKTRIFNAVDPDLEGGEYRRLAKILEIKSALLVPLQVRGEAIGLISVFDKEEGARFTEQDIQVLQTIANQMAIAVSNVQYYNDLQRTNQELLHKTEEAEEASRLKSQFLSNVSHELRTPLNAIIGYTSLILDGIYGKVDYDQRMPLEGVARNANDLLRLVNDVLDLSKIEAGKLTYHVEEVDLSLLIKEVLVGMKPLFEEKSLSVEYRTEDGLSPIYSDPGKIRQVLVNLLSNAVKFTKRGGITVSVRDRLEASRVEIAVRDTGIGIKEEELPKIFDAFHQVDGAATREFGGVGLGLAIVKELIELLNGEIRVESDYGSGSTFTVSLPRRLVKK